MTILYRSLLLIFCVFALAACGKSPLEKDLETYARLNKEMHEFAESTKATMAFRAKTERHRGGSPELDALMGLLEGSKRGLDRLKLQDPQVQEQVNRLSTAYGNWAKYLQELKDNEGKREPDEQLEQEILADITKAKSQVTNAQNTLIAMGKDEGIAITVPFVVCSAEDVDCK
ncbi:hypothetical protein [Chitinilyticum litopenaei]|uniref:hypothetical protein n=1 Tax=Chitinilyticum litopenaei TaxID=1121276 RepID=UPI00042A8690|nr:hypothetical protein [Chitinilyticum litopenaei]